MVINILLLTQEFHCLPRFVVVPRPQVYKGSLNFEECVFPICLYNAIAGLKLVVSIELCIRIYVVVGNRTLFQFEGRGNGKLGQPRSTKSRIPSTPSVA